MQRSASRRFFFVLLLFLVSLSINNFFGSLLVQAVPRKRTPTASPTTTVNDAASATAASASTGTLTLKQRREAAKAAKLAAANANVDAATTTTQELPFSPPPSSSTSSRPKSEVSSSSPLPPPPSSSSPSAVVTHNKQFELDKRTLFRASFFGDVATMQRLLFSSGANDEGSGSSADADGVNEPKPHAHELVNSLFEGKTAIITLLEGAHTMFDSQWPNQRAPSSHMQCLQLLFRSGADTSLLCPTLEAVTYRDIFALRQLLRRMNDTAALDCIAARDGHGSNLLSNTAHSTVAGVSRLFFRADRLDAKDPARGILMNQISIPRIPSFAASRTREMRKAELEVLVGTPDLDTVVDAVRSRQGTFEELLLDRNVEGLNPLLIACIEGRALFVKKLLGLVVAAAAAAAAGDDDNNVGGGVGSISSSIREGTGDDKPITVNLTLTKSTLLQTRVIPRRSASEAVSSSPLVSFASKATVGDACAHIAATRGYVDILKEIYAAVGKQGLLLPDANGNIPCDLATAYDSSSFIQSVAQQGGAAATSAKLAASPHLYDDSESESNGSKRPPPNVLSAVVEYLESVGACPVNIDDIADDSNLESEVEMEEIPSDAEINVDPFLNEEEMEGREQQQQYDADNHNDQIQSNADGNGDKYRQEIVTQETSRDDDDDDGKTVRKNDISSETQPDGISGTADTSARGAKESSSGSSGGSSSGSSSSKQQRVETDTALPKSSMQAMKIKAAGVHLRNFNVSQHFTAGWKILSSAQLAVLGLPSDLFRPILAQLSVASAHRTQKSSSVVVEAKSSSKLSPLAAAIQTWTHPIDLLPAAVLEDIYNTAAIYRKTGGVGGNKKRNSLATGNAADGGSADSNSTATTGTTLLQRYMSYARPFMIERVFPPKAILSESNGGSSFDSFYRSWNSIKDSSSSSPPTSAISSSGRLGSSPLFKTPITIEAFTSSFQSLPNVLVGDLPYSASYGVSATSMTIPDFVQKYMGVSGGSNAARKAAALTTHPTTTTTSASSSPSPSTSATKTKARNRKTNNNEEIKTSTTVSADGTTTTTTSSSSSSADTTIPVSGNARSDNELNIETQIENHLAAVAGAAGEDIVEYSGLPSIAFAAIPIRKIAKDIFTVANAGTARGEGENKKLTSSSSSSSFPYVFDGKGMVTQAQQFQTFTSWAPFHIFGKLFPTLSKSSGGNNNNNNENNLNQQQQDNDVGGGGSGGEEEGGGDDGGGNIKLQQFAIGPPLSGAQPHFHLAAVNVGFIGLKLWLLFPPGSASFADASAYQWYTSTYVHRFNRTNHHHHRKPTSVPSEEGEDALAIPHYAFIQEPGDLVYVPPHWGHAVLNLADSFAIAIE